jgi:hypothetical protein
VIPGQAAAGFGDGDAPARLALPLPAGRCAPGGGDAGGDLGLPRSDTQDIASSFRRRRSSAAGSIAGDGGAFAVGPADEKGDAGGDGRGAGGTCRITAGLGAGAGLTGGCIGCCDDRATGARNPCGAPAGFGRGESNGPAGPRTA